MAQEAKKPTPEEYARHKAAGEKHKLENPLRDVILGGQDGLVNALGIILGIAAVTADKHILVATVLAATCAESISMGAVAYTSSLAQKDHYESERNREMREMEVVPEIEREEIRQIFLAKGFQGKVLEEIVETVTSDKKLWLSTMMADELGLQPVEMGAVLKTSVIVTIATAIGHVIPLVPFFFVDGTRGIGLLTAVVISAITLFAVGVYQAVTLVGTWWKAGVRMAIIGIGAAFIGYLIASLFHAVG